MATQRSAEKAWLAVLMIGLGGIYRERADSSKADAEMAEFRRLQRPNR